MAVKFEINLQHLSVIAVADSYWNTKEILNETKIYFCSPTKCTKLTEWDLLTEDVIFQIDREALPEILYFELVHAVDTLGKKKRDWFRCCRMRNIFRDMPREELYEYYLKTIHWTHYGTVDEEKIVSSWVDNPNCDIWKVYVMASCFCSEEVTKKIWMKVSKTYKAEDFENLYKSYGWHLAAYWDRLFRNDLNNFIEDLKLKFWNRDFYDESKSIEENMFRLSIAKGYKQTAKKFWKELNEKDKIKIIVESLDLVVHHNANRSRTIAKYYRQDASTEIFLFLLNDYISFVKRELIEKKDDIHLRAILFHLVGWPWVNFLIPFAIGKKEFLGKIEYNIIFQEILNRENKKFVSISEDKFFRCKLLELWKNLSPDNKKEIGEAVACELFTALDFKCLKKILNDIDVSDIKKKMIAKGFYKFENFVEKNNEEMIKKFIDLLIPIKLENNIRKKMEMIYEHVLKCEFDLVDELLKSFCRSEQEMEGFKNEINCDLICRYFILKNQLDLADKFLRWKLNSEESVKAFKFTYYYKDFSMRHILRIWSDEENVEEAKLKSDNFLNWFLHSDELLKFFFIKKNFYISNLAFRRFPFSIIPDYKIVDGLLDWCLMNEEEKELYKNYCFFSDVQIFARIAFLIELDQLECAITLLDWLYGSDELKKEEFMRKFLASDRWAYSIKLLIAYKCSLSQKISSKKEIEGNMKKFIKKWMKLAKKYKFNDYNRVLEEWPAVYDEMVQREKSLKLDSDSSDESDAEDVSDDHQYVHCDKENLKIFKGLLDSYNKGDYSEFSD